VIFINQTIYNAMKRNKRAIFIIVSSICLVVYNEAQGQSYNSGLQLAFVYPRLNGNDIEKTGQSSIGFNLGVYVNSSYKNIFLEPQLFYKMRRYHEVISPYIPSYADHSFDLHYLTFGVLCGSYVLSYNDIGLYGGLGPYIGLLLNSVDIDHDYYSDNDFKPYEVGGIIEIGIDLAKVFSVVPLKLSFRYEQDFWGIYDLGYSPDIKKRSYDFVLKILY